MPLVTWVIIHYLIFFLVREIWRKKKKFPFLLLKRWLLLRWPHCGPQARLPNPKGLWMQSSQKSWVNTHFIWEIVVLWSSYLALPQAVCRVFCFTVHWKLVGCAVLLFIQLRHTWRYWYSAVWASQRTSFHFSRGDQFWHLKHMSLENRFARMWTRG